MPQSPHTTASCSRGSSSSRGRDKTPTSLRKRPFSISLPKKMQLNRRAPILASIVGISQHSTERANDDRASIFRPTRNYGKVRPRTEPTWRCYTQQFRTSKTKKFPAHERVPPSTAAPPVHSLDSTHPAWLAPLSTASRTKRSTAAGREKRRPRAATTPPAPPLLPSPLDFRSFFSFSSAPPSPFVDLSCTAPALCPLPFLTPHSASRKPNPHDDADAGSLSVFSPRKADLIESGDLRAIVLAVGLPQHCGVNA